MPNVTSEMRQEIQTALDGVYTVERELADGGTAHLFVATEVALGRRVALKVLRPELRAAIDATRFRREIQLAAGLTHPNIVPILAAGEAGGFLYYTMPFLEGHSLRVLLDLHGALAVGDAVSILHDLARALAYAHSRGIVHRDVKPDNVLVDHGTALLTDFGIAMALDAATIERTDRRSTRRGVGTPMYVSPEQSTGDPRLDQRSDLYSLGVVAYEMLAGRPPFTYRTQDAMLAAHRTEVPSPIASRHEGLPSGLAQLVMRLLEKRPEDRPQTAEEVLRLLDGGVSVPVPVAAPARRRQLTRAAMFAIVVLASALGAMIGFVVTRATTAGRVTATTESAELAMVERPAKAGRPARRSGVATTVAGDVAPAVSRDHEETWRRIRDGAAGTYIREVLFEHDSSLARWPERTANPLRVWVGTGTGLRNWDSTHVRRVRDAFQEWSAVGAPVRFTFVTDSADADIHVTWTEHFTGTISGKTVWARDGHWWIVNGTITIALHHNGDDVLGGSAITAIALHEVGHVLGLDHTMDTTNIMTPTVRVRALSDADRATLRLLYSLPPGSLVDRRFQSVRSVFTSFPAFLDWLF